MKISHVKEQAQLMMRAPILDVALIKGGANNKIFKVISTNGMQAILKFYHMGNREADTIRLRREYESLTFLKEQHENQVPTPLEIDKQNICALYEWIEGEKISSISNADLDEVILFIKRLKQYSLATNAEKLLPASDNALVLETVIEQIQRRLNRIICLTEEKELSIFLNTQFQPVFKDALNQIKISTLNSETTLSYQHAILSPSDFGFHNILRSNTKLVFIDFEYFGWEDPAALLAHFLWHPGMHLSDQQHEYFISQIKKIFITDAGFELRFNILVPLIGLVWTLIILNEFIPELWKRRVGSGAVSKTDFQKRTQQQLQKAKHYLERVINVRYVC